MTEFGHTPNAGLKFRMDSWGTGPFVIDVGGKRYKFEDSLRFGPALLRKNGALKANPYPSEKHPFWNAHAAWAAQGRRLEENGINCIWDNPKPTVVRRMGGKNLLIVEHGDEHGDIIYLD